MPIILVPALSLDSVNSLALSVAKLSKADSTNAASLSLVTEAKASNTSLFVIVLGSLDLILAKVLNTDYFLECGSIIELKVIPLCLDPNNNLSYYSAVP